MSDIIDGKPSTTFWIISGAALVWNLIGLVFYVEHVRITPEAIAALAEAHQDFLLATPIWATAAFAVAVNAGVLGSILLLLRRAWAVPVLAISLVAIVVQNIDAFVLRDAFGIIGVGSIIIPAMVFVIGIALLMYARACKECGWLS